MPKYPVEVQYLLPVWARVIVVAEDADKARQAVIFDESGHTWDNTAEDYEFRAHYDRRVPRDLRRGDRAARRQSRPRAPPRLHP